jgi:hypothetical protein
LSLAETPSGTTKQMGALVSCVTKELEVNLASVDLFPWVAFHGSRVLLAGSDSGSTLHTISRLLGPSQSLSARTTLMRAGHRLKGELVTHTRRAGCRTVPQHRWHDKSEKTGLDPTSETKALKNTARKTHDVAPSACSLS